MFTHNPHNPPNDYEVVLRTTKRHVADCEKILKFTKIGSVTYHKLIQTAFGAFSCVTEAVCE